MGILKRILFHGPQSGKPANRPVPKRTYLVERGDMLWTIARREYGDANWWYEIFTANCRRIKMPEFIHPGMTLRLP